MDLDKLKFDERGLIPAIAQVVQTLAEGSEPANVVNREFLSGNR